MGTLDNKVAIVTGAGAGIGAASAQALAAAGAAVVVGDINGDGAAAVAAQIVADGGRAVAVAFDLGIESDIRRVVATATDTWGRLDIVHNNAAATGLAASSDKGIADADPAVWDQMFHINVTGAMLMIKHAAPLLAAQGGGAIINTSSPSGLTGDLMFSAYGASKAAIISLTQFAATQYGAQGIRVNVISPGMIRTQSRREAGREGAHQERVLKHLLIKRPGAGEDVAHMVVFLASDQASYITGQTIGVDGGILSHVPHFGDVTSGQ